MQGDPNCTICKGAGYVERDVPIDHPDFSRVFPCKCIAAKLAREQLEKSIGASDLPPGMAEMTFDAFKPAKAVRLTMPLPEDKSYEAQRIRARIWKLRENGADLTAHLRRAKRRCLAFAKQPEGFLTLMGETGCGKTHLAVAIVHHTIQNGGTAVFAVIPDLLDNLRATFDRQNTRVTYAERMDTYLNVPLLALDDLGTESPTDWAGEKLYQIINYRYNQQLPTVVTTNEIPLGLDSRLRSRLFDRRNCVFEILAGDYRTGAGG